MEETKTSLEWAIHHCVVIYDADGWDRKNYDWSWGVELITEEEFLRRKSLSTILMEAVAPKGYKLFTFRTEGPNDEKRVPQLLDLMDWKPCYIGKLPDGGNWYEYQYTIAVPESTDLEETRTILNEHIYAVKGLEDLHRCAQTLNEGKRPDERWWERGEHEELGKYLEGVDVAERLREALSKKRIKPDDIIE